MVSPTWLNKALNDPDLIILEASSLSHSSDASQDLNREILPKARPFDLKETFSLKTTKLPHMMPSAKQFEQGCRQIGINTSSKIVVYDHKGIYFSPRVWWMFKVMGHKAVYVLNGGLLHWKSKGFATELKRTEQNEIGNFKAVFNKKAVKDFNFIKENIHKQEYLLIDARASNRFLGTAPEPREGIQSGSIPHAINLPFSTVLKNGTFKNKKELITIFKNLNINKRPLIFSCGSGITACIILLAYQLVGNNETAVYDGSWTEWALRTQKQDNNEKCI